LWKLERYEEALASYDQALHFQPDFHEAWNNRGVAAGNSVNFDPLLASQSAIARKHPALNQRGYEGELASYEQGLNYCPQDTHPEGWGLLHQAIGNAHYFRGRGDSRPRPYWHNAVKSYKEALKTLTAAAFPEAHLEILQGLLRIPPFLRGARGDREGLDSTYSPSLRQLIEFENWIETWKKDYQKYRQGTRQQNEETRRDTQETLDSSAEPNKWRDEMPKRLEKLAEILNIEGLLPHIQGVSQLILIPHRDLHLLPLHALFPDDFTITYLPSIKVGLDRKTPKPNTSLLSVENPTNDLRFAPLESELICKLYPKNQRLTKSAATKTAVKTALSQGFGIFHFAGHSEHNLNQPAQSALILANKERLTLKDILELDLSHYNFVGLSGCETNFTSKIGLIEEFVGLASGFVAAGANNVVGSLWNVSDRATAYFMRKFHEILIASDTDVPSALKQAQYLLRNVTKKELEEWETTLPSPLSQERSLRMPVQKPDGETDANAKPFESPYYWAAFCAIG
jgi:CHAT domain-containing protein